MKLRVPDYLKEFKCIASQCEDTCCAGWEVVIDEDSYKKYKKAKGEFGKRLRSEIIHREGENIFTLKGDNCAFLNENKMCDLYTELGEDSLCYTCKMYPRHIEEFGNLREIGISLSCPEAARLILRHNKKVEFEVSEIQEEITSYNDIDALLFINLLQCRKVIFHILQNRNIKLEHRISLVLKFTNEVQEGIDEDNLMGIKPVMEKYLDMNFIEGVISNLGKYKGKDEVKYNNMKEFLKVFKELKHINPNDPLGLEKVLNFFWNSDNEEESYLDKHKQFNQYYEDNLYKFENLLVYFVFRYFMKAVFDYDAAAKVNTAVVSYLMIKELFVFRWTQNGELTEEDAVDIMHMYSKDIEHLEENIEALAEVFKTNPVFELEELLSILMN
ncbi:flagellin lysine-N-methylase [Clostridium tunisiense]|uniref:flagellin lysine-N-methylase n=1 Tax=Clostridium tunisiense TaxID=219748 RepID=UPI0003191DCA|nr:flagellin lysine-N-methylase [Clostridium tunisiense]